jgi:hypothetical protein
MQIPKIFFQKDALEMGFFGESLWKDRDWDMFLKRVPCGCKNFFLKSSRCFHQFEDDGCDLSGIL